MKHLTGGRVNAASTSASADGFAYAIIGGVGPAAFYAKAVGAVDIAGSTPGIYGGMLAARGD